MRKDEMEVKNVELKEQELECVSGGAWGYHTYHNETMYNAAGVRTEWTKNPFAFDKFFFGGKEIDKGTASAIVFYAHRNSDAHQDMMEEIKAGRGNIDSFLNDAIQFKGQNGALFAEDVKACNL